MNIIPLLDNTIAVDNFNRANGALGNAQTGQPWILIGDGVSWSIDAGKARYTHATIGGAACINAFTPHASVESIITYGGNDGLAGRFVDHNNYYTVRFAASGLAVLRFIAGVFTTVGSFNMTLVLGQAYHLKAMFAGTNILVFLNGALCMTVTNESSHMQGTGFGLRVFNSPGGRYDDFRLEAL